MGTPSIKGSGFVSAVEDVRRLLAEGRISQAELEARLTPEDFAFLQGNMLASSWYPLDSYDRLILVLLEKEGGGDRQYIVERGRRAAERLYKAGLYRQLQATMERWGERFGSLMEGLGGAMFSETSWRVERVGTAEDPTTVIEVLVAPEFPESARLATLGFIEFLGEKAAGFPVYATGKRVAPTRILFEAGRR